MQKDKIKTNPVTVVDSLSKEDFLKNYYLPQKPVLIKNLTKNWGAYSKWNLDYIQSLAGDQVVPLYNNQETKGRQKSALPATQMKLYDYLEILKTQPTDLRIFFYSIVKKMPILLKDFEYPDLGIKFFKTLPTMFFGGEGSKVLIHYDMDLANLFHIHFHGKKHIILFSPEQSKYLYRVPFTVHNIERIDIDKPDLKLFPALKYAEGLEVEMEHGDTLFIPSGYWHYIKYLNGGFSITLRSFATKPKVVMKMMYNIFIMRHMENLMRKSFGQKWLDYKEKKVIKKTNKLLQKLQ